ncbi:MAG: FAD-binding oxidoreductase [Salinarimonadaceae bacterium]|nr:MAG: FAD-binding oxidoreductase [Salinarimonadaceae bacterium]
MTVLTADVAIVGAGLIGCMLARDLALGGRSVVVIDKGRVGGESSGVSFGSLRIQGTRGTSLEFALRAQTIWENVETEIGRSVEFDPSGHVHLALDEAQVERLEENARHLRAHGAEVEIVGRNEIARRWPFLARERVVAASWSSRDALVNPRLVAPAFAAAAARLGVRIVEEAEVIAAERKDGRFRLRTGSRVAPSIVADVLVNAAGAWCGRLAALFGEHIPVFAAGPAEIVTEPVERFLGPVIHVVDGSVLFRQTRRGNLIVAGHPRMSVDMDSRDNRVPPAKILVNLGRLAAIAPGLGACHVLRTWTGIEGYVPDMNPVLGPSATTPGLFHACAFSGHGLQVGPAASVALTELITTGRTDMPIDDFGVERFAEDRARAVPTMGEEFSHDVIDKGAKP